MIGCEHVAGIAANLTCQLKGALFNNLNHLPMLYMMQQVKVCGWLKPPTYRSILQVASKGYVWLSSGWVSDVMTSSGEPYAGEDQDAKLVE